MYEACADFAHTSLSDDVGLSRDDLKFINIVEDSVTQCKSGYYQILLPLKKSILEDTGEQSSSRT